MFSNGAYLNIWKVTDAGRYYEVEVSSNKKNKETNQYECDFSANFVRFCGRAYQLRPMANQRIKVISCAVTNCYMKDGRRVYTKNPTYIIFDYELADDGNGNAPRASTGEYNPYADNNSSFSPLDLESEGALPF